MDLPEELSKHWSHATDATDPVQALRAVADLRADLGRWEAMLARQALADGASWATIGDALGTSRQAAWERLRPLIKQLIEADRVRLEQEKTTVRRRRTGATATTTPGGTD